MLRIVCISDTHCQLSKVNLPEGDVLVLTGDLSYRGTLKEMSTELDILAKKGNKFKHRSQLQVRPVILFVRNNVLL
jgi:predicted phosphodiesterase